MVGEFPELQGHVGKLLARHDGEEEAVAVAIEEHYLPRFSGDDTPATPAGRAAAAADRIDTLTGCFHHGLKPKGSADPLGLRRAAVGLVALLLASGTRVQLDALLGESELDGGDALLDFVVARLRNNMMERHATDVVDAVLATGDRDPVALEGRAAAMSALSQTPDFEPMKQTFKRLANITRDHESTDYDADALAEPAEQALHAALEEVRAAAAASAAAGDFSGALARLSALKSPVDALFDAVMVMAEDPTVRANRLGLLASVGAAFRDIADFKQLS
jgi:glycyl-tRNA synthetase beta chain